MQPRFSVFAPQRLRFFCAILATGVGLSGCGDATSGGEDAASAVGDSASIGDLAGTDLSDLGAAPDSAVKAEIAPLEVAGSDTKSCPGAPGCACEKNENCDNALCIDTPAGKHCAQPCIDKCADNFKCAQVTGSGGDVQTICVPTWGKLCDPCTTSAACTALGQGTPACVVHGDAGAFCGADCKADTDCPGGHSCTEFKTVEGATAKACAPKVAADGKPGLCACSPAAMAAGLATTCSAPAKDDKGNVVGGCPGTRKCGDKGLGACDAPAAAPEVCDSLDNDCDGKTDEESCDDGNACTDDKCGVAAGKATCQHAASQAPCDDKNICTSDDVCKDSACTAGVPKVCADTNPCTLDSCDPLTGCAQSQDDGAPCDDDNPCTVGDLCQAGKCLAGLPKDCTSTDACQSAKCAQDDGKCAYTDKQDGLPCNDGTVCTAADYCKTGVCGGTLIPCDDGNPCTSDACDNASGCTSTFATIACTDGNACTEGDQCVEGKCKTGAVKNCDDNDGCTLDACDGGSGTCINGAITGCGGNCKADGDCNDGNPCTTDSCAAGKCAVAVNTLPCDDKDLCTETDICGNGFCAGAAVNCDDKNPCTTDGCAFDAGCGHDANSLGCDDGDACSVGDTCAAKACKPGTVTVCDDKNPCTDDGCDTKTGTCTVVANKAVCSDDNACTSGDTCASSACVPGTAKVCSDGNGCTDDKCDPVSGACVAANNAAACNDGNACTTPDTCSAGACKPGVAKICNDGDACTIDSCDKLKGTCVATPIVGCGGNCKVVADCDDKNPCTTDACTAGKCANSANLLACSDGDGCTLNDVCGGGACKPGSAKVCNDGNGCTDDKCDSATGACVVTNNAAPCNDNDACTLNDTCKAGVCAVGTAVVCDDKNPCTVGDACKLGACVPGAATVCDDKNGCTNDSCDLTTGKCLFANNTNACSDGNACTIGDVCALGACKPGGPQNCDDKNVCTTDSCDKVTGKCAAVKNTVGCTDNNACTVGDVCAVGLCTAGTPTNCDDKNACTTEKCDITGKCAYTNLATTTLCDDGNLCTASDKCDGLGKCLSGPQVVCKATACNSSACSAATGQCVVTPQPNTVGCDDLQICTVGDKCDGAGKCASGPWNNTCGCQTAAACNDNNACTTDTCVAAKCVFTITNGAACDDGDVCTTGSACDSVGKCVGNAKVDCAASNDQCNTGACFDNAGLAGCKKVPKTTGTACTDGLFCTTGETCDTAGKCASGLPVSCGKPAQCHTSLCTELTKGCTTPNMADGTGCTDGSACTGTDVCKAGTCVGTVAASCTPVLTTFNPASPSTATATNAAGSGVVGTSVYVYPTATCTGTAYNAKATPALPGFSVAVAAAKQACTTVSAQAVDAAGNKSACSNTLTFNNYSCTQCPCTASDWIRRFGGAKSDVATSAAVESTGNSYVAGYTDGGIAPATLVGAMDGFLTKHDAVGARLWTVGIGTTADDSASAVVMDNAGAIWVGGNTAGDIDGAGPGTLPPVGDIDAFFARYDANGKQNLIKVWASATRRESVVDMRWDATNSRIVALIGSSEISGGGASPQVVAVAPATGVITKLWEFIDASQNKNVTGMHVDGTGNIYVHGRSQWAITGALTTTGTAGGGLFLYKIASTGKQVWLQHWGSPAFDYGGGVVDDGTQVYATGFAQGIATGTPSGTVYGGSTGISWGHLGDMVVGAFDATTGAPVWVSQLGTAGGDSGNHLQYITGKLGGLYIIGHTNGNMEAGTGVSKYGKQDITVTKMMFTGTLVSKKQLGTALDDGAGRPAQLVGAALVPGWSDADWIGQSPDACLPIAGREATLAHWCQQ